MKRNWRSHYILVLANIILIATSGINFAVRDLLIKSIDSNLFGGNFYFLLICPLISILITGFLYFLDIKYFVKDYPYKKFHFNKKWTVFYIVGIVIYCFNLLLIFSLSIVMVLLSVNQINNPSFSDEKVIKNYISNVTYIILWFILGFSCLMSLLSFGFIKYARFKIDVELLQREKGSIVDGDKTDSKSVIINLEPETSKVQNDSKDKIDNSKLPTASLSNN
ncbi:DUF5453 family protein [Mycoplasmoides alvi]|uniref:DUF5453 family protein n=1 Tax=Mycoplasmoides alvi TaxID=78580 RepID=UPI00051C6A9A|nr:DUF5453 family protein [Mycoplasmoides alvi]